MALLYETGTWEKSTIILYRHRYLYSPHKKHGIYIDTAENVEIRFDTSSYKLDNPLPRGKNRKVIELLKNQLHGKAITNFVVLRQKTYNYLTNDSDGNKKGNDKNVI